MLENKKKNISRKKTVISSKRMLKSCQENMSYKDFCDRFELDIEFSTALIKEELLAKVVSQIEMTDRAMTAAELITLN